MLSGMCSQLNDRNATTASTAKNSGNCILTAAKNSTGHCVCVEEILQLFEVLVFRRHDLERRQDVFERSRKGRWHPQVGLGVLVAFCSRNFGCFDCSHIGVFSAAGSTDGFLVWNDGITSHRLPRHAIRAASVPP